MNTVQQQEVRDGTLEWVATLDAALTSVMSRSDSNALIREIFATLLLLRWIDLHDLDEEALAASERRPPQTFLPHALQWRHWNLPSPTSAIIDKLYNLTNHLEILSSKTDYSELGFLQALAAPLRRILAANLVDLIDFIFWLSNLPCGGQRERQVLLEILDQVIADTGSSYDGMFSTPVNIARLVVALANPQLDDRIYDPCFGTGNFLVAAWQHAERNRVAHFRKNNLKKVTGVEINERIFFIGMTRMLLAGIRNPHLELANSLERELLSQHFPDAFDLVLANPPIGAKNGRERWRYNHFAFPANDSTGLFVQHALSHLKPNGRAVIAVPEGFLFRGGADRELRRHLLEQGQVEAVIGLPAGAFAPYTRIRGSLLVLSKQGGANQVQMADASNLFEQSPGRKVLTIHSEIAQQLANEIRHTKFGKQGGGSDVGEGTDSIGKRPHSVWKVSIEELADADWDLSPRRREKGGLHTLLGNIKEALGESGDIASLSDVAKVMTGKFIKSVDLLDVAPLTHAVGYVRIKDLNQGKVSRPSSWLRPEVADQEQRGNLLLGDVLISKSGTIGKAALVHNEVIGSIAASSLYVLQTDQKRLDPGFLLAYLASPSCQNWLAAQSRGAVSQHLNRAVFDALPIPLPPLQMQASAAAQFQEFGTDALVFLAHAFGSSKLDKLTTWMAELHGKIPRFSPGLDDTPSISLLEPIESLVDMAWAWPDLDRLNQQTGHWFLPLVQLLIRLKGVSQMPPGPGLLFKLHDAKSDSSILLTQSTGYLPLESQARVIIEGLRTWLNYLISDFDFTNQLEVRTTPTSLLAGTFSEFSVEIQSKSVLPLLNLRIETIPHWGSTELPYLAEQGRFTLNLRGDVPEQAEQLSLRFQWHATTLSTLPVGSTVELAIRVAKPEQASMQLASNLGTSPYVTGSPLEPKHGHNVFYGRENLIGQISRQIATHGNVVLLEGNRRAGKTSILKHLEGCSTTPGWLAVYASLQGAEGAAQVVGVPTEGVFREIARSIAVALSKLSIDVPLPNGQTLSAGKPALGVAQACREGISIKAPFDDFREFLEVVLAILEPLGLGLVLMLDEFDKLQEGIDSGVTSPQVPDNIRFLIQSYPKFSAILTGSRRLKRLREEYWSALYGLGTSFSVTVLDPESARKVIIEPVRDRLTFSREAIERLIEVTARHPYLMQCLCNRVFDYAVQTMSRSITVSVINDTVHGLVRDNEHFASLWDYAARGPKNGRHRRHMILLLCALSFKQGTHIDFGTLHEQLTQVGVEVTDEALDTDLSYLRELELIDFSGEIGDGEYRLSIPMMADWIEQQQDSDVVSSHARAEAEEENV